MTFLTYKQTPTRFHAADIARGLAVIYFIWCHSVNIHVAYVDTWPMPIFFMVMGLFFKPTTTWREMFEKKFFNIIVPFFLLSIPSYIQYAITLPVKSFIIKLINPFACVHGVGWFLICIFWCYLFYYGLVRLTKYNKKWVMVICLLLSFMSYYASTQYFMGYRIKLPFFISTALVVLPFICTGDILRDFLKKEFKWSMKALYGSLMVALTVVGAFLLNFRGVEYIDNYMYNQSWIVIIVLSIIGTVSILFISGLLPTFMGFAGEHSLLLLMVHPYILRIMRLFTAPNVVIFLVTLAVSLVLTWLLSRFCPILEGKK